MAQLDSELCAWGDDSRDCGLSTSGVLGLLEGADNAVAVYFHRLLVSSSPLPPLRLLTEIYPVQECALQRDGDSCDDRSCNWCVFLAKK